MLFYKFPLFSLYNVDMFIGKSGRFLFSYIRMMCVSYYSSQEVNNILSKKKTGKPKVGFNLEAVECCIATRRKKR